MDKLSRPSLTSFEGMIWNANHVLSYALDPGIRGIPKGYFMGCAGVVLMSSIQAGFMLSGSVGTGIFLKRDSEGNWSNPVACGMAAVGVGFQIGATSKDVIIFLPNDASVQTFFSSGVTLGAHSDVTIGVGRDLEGAVGVSGSGMAPIISIAYTKGAFVGASMEGALISPRKGANEAFYGAGNGDPEAIIEGKVKFPAHKITMNEELKEKLQKLSMGMTEKIGEAELKKAEQAAAEADKAAATLQTTAASDIVELEDGRKVGATAANQA